MENTFWKDLRIALRRLLRRPGFTVVVLLTLALGIGINTAIFTVVNAVLLRPLPFQDSERLVTVWQASLPAKERTVPVAPANYLDWREQNEVFEGTTAYINWNLNLSSVEPPEKILGTYVYPSFFPVLGVDARLGRTFLEEEARPGNEKVVVLSHDFWQNRYGGDPGILDRDVVLDGETFDVVGVMPEGFEFPDPEVEMWLPLAFEPEQISRGAQFLTVLARLKPGVGLEQAQSNMDSIAARLESLYPDDNQGWGAKVVSLREQLVGQVRPTLLVLLVAVGFLLLIACANVANLLLAQASVRQQEIALRTVLGASRGRLLRLLSAETLVIALAGGALGLLLAARATDVLVAMSAGALPRQIDVEMDYQVLLYTLGISLLTGLIFGLLPVRESLKLNLTGSLKEGGRGGSGGGGRMRSALVVAEVALAVVLLIGGGLMLRSFSTLRSQDPGFDPGSVLTARIGLPFNEYEEPARVAGFYRQLTESLEARPGVEAASTISALPLSGRSASRRFTIDGTVVAPGEEPVAGNSVVSAGYFEALRIPLLQGRTFAWRDDADAPLVAVVSRSAADAFWPGANPLGERLKFGAAGDDAPWRTVVGVVGDIRHTGLGEEPRAEIYTPLPQDVRNETSLVIRTEGTRPAAVVPVLRAEVKRLDPKLPISAIRPFEEVLSRSVERPRFYATLLNLFAVVGLLLTVVGIAGVMTYNVRRRTREIGIRMALGADRRDVLGLVLRHGLVLAVGGVAIGVAGALLLGRFLQGHLFGVTGHDLLTFVAVPLFLLLVAALAAWLPARRATRTEPVVALRYE